MGVISESVVIQAIAILAVCAVAWFFLLRGLLPWEKRRANDKKTNGVVALEVMALVAFYAGITRVVQNQMLATIFLGGFCVALIIYPRPFRVLLAIPTLVFALAYFDFSRATMLGYVIIGLFFVARVVFGNKPEPPRRIL